MARVSENSEQIIQTTVKVLEQVFGEAGGAVANVRLWDGAVWPEDRRNAVTLVLKYPGALNAMFKAGTELALAEAYLHDDFDIEGDMESVFRLYDILRGNTAGWTQKLSISKLLAKLPKPRCHDPGERGPAKLCGGRHTVSRDRKAVTYHYDVSGDFYSLWLDRRMVYSCAYFHGKDTELDHAQEMKLDYICRKLRLRPGQRLLDIGCGWGGLVIHAAGNYGVDATGITLSRPQAELAAARIAEAGLADRARVLVKDYREIPYGSPDNTYDALVSVGMFEHVGVDHLPEYFARAWELLRPGGVFLNHGIACQAAKFGKKAASEFFRNYVFPDGELAPVSGTLCAAETARFEVRDLESLREHYLLTLRHWLRRLEERHTEALRLVDEPTFRVWKLFIAASAYTFDTGSQNLYQALLVKPTADGRSGLPLTRDDWYT